MNIKIIIAAILLGLMASCTTDIGKKMPRSGVITGSYLTKYKGMESKLDSLTIVNQKYRDSLLWEQMMVVLCPYNGSGIHRHTCENQ